MNFKVKGQILILCSGLLDVVAQHGHLITSGQHIHDSMLFARKTTNPKTKHFFLVNISLLPGISINLLLWVGLLTSHNYFTWIFELNPVDIHTANS